MKKRFLSIALTLAMVSSMAVGCGSSKSDSADSKKEERDYRTGFILCYKSVVKPGITGFFKIDLHIKCYIYLS